MSTTEAVDKRAERRKILASPKYNRIGFKDEQVRPVGREKMAVRSGGDTLSRRANAGGVLDLQVLSSNRRNFVA